MTFAVVRSAKHMTALAVPAKLFIGDLTICVDVSPNPGPAGFQNGSRISDNYENI